MFFLELLRAPAVKVSKADALGLSRAIWPSSWLGKVLLVVGLQK